MIQKLESILNPKAKPCLSVYIPSLSETFSNDDRKKLFLNFIQEAHEMLLKDKRKININKFMESVWLANPYKEIEKTTSSLGFFFNHDLGAVLPIQTEVTPKFIIADSFHIKPIIGWIQESPPYLLITLTGNEVKIFSGDVFGMKFIKSIRRDEVQNGKKGNYKKELESYFQKTHEEIIKIAPDFATPILVTGIDWMQALFVKVSKRPNIFLTEIKGNSSKLQVKELRKMSLSFFKKAFQLFKEKTLNRFLEKKQKGLVLTKPDQIAQAIYEGKVKELLVASDQALWGELNHKGQILSIHPYQQNSKDDDILDDLAEKMLNQGGKVLCLPRKEIFEQKKLVAIL